MYEYIVPLVMLHLLGSNWIFKTLSKTNCLRITVCFNVFDPYFKSTNICCTEGRHYSQRLTHADFFEFCFVLEWPCKFYQVSADNCVWFCSSFEMVHCPVYCDMFK